MHQTDRSVDHIQVSLHFAFDSCYEFFLFSGMASDWLSNWVVHYAKANLNVKFIT